MSYSYEKRFTPGGNLTVSEINAIMTAGGDGDEDFDGYGDVGATTTGGGGSQLPQFDAATATFLQTLAQRFNYDPTAVASTSDITNLQNQFNSLQQQSATLETDYAVLLTNDQLLSKRLTTVENDMTTAKTDITTLESEATGLQTQITNNQISNGQEFTTINTDIKTLQDQLANMSGGSGGETIDSLATEIKQRFDGLMFYLTSCGPVPLVRYVYRAISMQNPFNAATDPSAYPYLPTNGNASNIGWMIVPLSEMSPKCIVSGFQSLWPMWTNISNWGNGQPIVFTYSILNAIATKLLLQIQPAFPFLDSTTIGKSPYKYVTWIVKGRYTLGIDSTTVNEYAIVYGILAGYPSTTPAPYSMSSPTVVLSPSVRISEMIKVGPLQSTSNGSTKHEQGSATFETIILNDSFVTGLGATNYSIAPLFYESRYPLSGTHHSIDTELDFDLYAVLNYVKNPALVTTTTAAVAEEEMINTENGTTLFKLPLKRHRCEE